jgi:hypothetical protein
MRKPMETETANRPYGSGEYESNGMYSISINESPAKNVIKPHFREEYLLVTADACCLKMA